MRTPVLALVLSALLIAAPSSSQCAENVQSQSGSSGQNQSSPTAQSQFPAQQNPVDVAKSPIAGQFVLQDGTPIKLRLSRNVSSADATVNESVDFEVLEEILVNGVVVIPKGGTAIGTVTEAVPKRRMGRAGKLEIVLDYVRLADKEKAAVRAVKDAKGGSHTAGMTAGIVVTGLLVWPAAPFFLFMHGKDITVPKGAEITAYVNGDLKLDMKNFAQSPEANGNAPASNSTPVPSQAAPAPAAPAIGSIEVHSNPDSAEVYADGAFIGNAPATLKLSPGQHTIRVTIAGYKEWTRDLTVQAGSEAHLTANLEKQE